MLTAAAWFLAGVVVLLAVPVDLRVAVHYADALSVHVAIHWLFGLVRFAPRFLRDKEPSRPDEPTAEQAPPAPPARTTLEPRPRKSPGVSLTERALAVLRSKGFMQRLLRLQRDLVRQFRTHDFSLYLRLGLDDPAATGQLWGLLGPVTGLLAGCRQGSVTLVPDFSGAVCLADGKGVIRFIPLRVIYILFGFLLAPALWRALWAGFRPNRGG